MCVSRSAPWARPSTLLTGVAAIMDAPSVQCRSRYGGGTSHGRATARTAWHPCFYWRFRCNYHKWCAGGLIILILVIHVRRGEMDVAKSPVCGQFFFFIAGLYGFPAESTGCDGKKWPIPQWVASRRGESPGLRKSGLQPCSKDFVRWIQMKRVCFTTRQTPLLDLTLLAPRAQSDLGSRPRRPSATPRTEDKVPVASVSASQISRADRRLRPGSGGSARRPSL